MVYFVDDVMPFVEKFAINGEASIFADDSVSSHKVRVLGEIAAAPAVLGVDNLVCLSDPQS